MQVINTGNSSQSLPLPAVGAWVLGGSDTRGHGVTSHPVQTSAETIMSEMEDEAGGMEKMVESLFKARQAAKQHQQQHHDQGGWQREDGEGSGSSGGEGPRLGSAPPPPGPAHKLKGQWSGLGQ